MKPYCIHIAQTILPIMLFFNACCSLHQAPQLDNRYQQAQSLLSVNDADHIGLPLKTNTKYSIPHASHTGMYITDPIPPGGLTVMTNSQLATTP